MQEGKRVSELDTAKLDGIEEGLKQGLKQGVEKGERNKTLEIAKNSIKQGLDNQTISLITNLSIKEIQTLREGTTL